MNKKIIWGIIGCGDVVKRLVKNSFFIKNISEVDTVMSLNLQEAENFSKKYNINKFTNNSNDIFNNKKINAVYIACTPDKHFEYIIKSSNSNKMILCEKPLVLNKYQLKKVEQICQKNKTILITCFYRRYQEKFIFIKKIIKKNLGKLFFFRISHMHQPETHPTAPIKNNKKKIPWRFVKKISGGGNFLDMGSHYLDIINMLIGEIKNVHSYFDNYANLYNVEDTITLNFKLKNNVIGTGIWCSVANKDEDSFEIFGSKGKINFSLNNSNKITLETKKKREYNFPMVTPLHKPLIRHVITMFQKYLYKKKYFISSSDLNISKFQLEALRKK